jgi:hypothetical protein
MHFALLFQLEFTLRETTLVEEEMHNCESLTERIKECQPYIEEVSRLQPPLSPRTSRISPRRRRARARRAEPRCPPPPRPSRAHPGRRRARPQRAGLTLIDREKLDRVEADGYSKCYIIFFLSSSSLVYAADTNATSTSGLPHSALPL